MAPSFLPEEAFVPPENGAAVAPCAAAIMPEGVFPTPGFEGMEKRIEVDFATHHAAGKTLRDVPQYKLQDMLDLAECTIVSCRTSEHFDAYVLSESSLFVYPTKMVLKTCGTTKLLNACGKMIELAEEVGQVACRVKYTRGNYLFPSSQPYPHTSFSQEIEVLKHHFRSLLGEGSAYVLGDALKGFQWHLYVAGNDEATEPEPSCTVEVCMTGLHSESMSHFFRDETFSDASLVTKNSGIAGLFPNAEIDDYVFHPCGYSMNGLDGKGFSTIHITPEDGFSYTSVELCGHHPEAVDPRALVSQICDIFRPTCISVALTMNSCTEPGFLKWVRPFASPEKYSCAGAAMQDFPCGGKTVYHQFTVLEEFSHSKLSRSLSPASVLDTFSCSSDDEMCCLNERSSPCLSFYDGPKLNSSLDTGAMVRSKAATSLSAVLAAYSTTNIESAKMEHVEGFMRQVIKDFTLEDTFYVMDLGAVVRRFRTWQDAMPNVRPYYAVKCNPDPALLGVLAALGAGFDCASSAELDKVISLGVLPNDIIFANACKMPSHISFMCKSGVLRTTFDNEQELHKIKALHPKAELILRIRADDPSARCQLGNKFGAEEDEVPLLLQEARRLNLNVVGISFHVGSGGTDPLAFVRAIEASRKAFDIALEAGFQPSLLDIGGGFSGGSCEDRVDGLWKVADAVNTALETHFPVSTGVCVIAEPGRYFAEASATLAAIIYGKRSRWLEQKPHMDYWISDGLYGSFNCLLYDHASVTCSQLRLSSDGGMIDDRLTYQSTIFGPTCDGLDTVLRGYPLPKLNVGDWLVFPSMGAYTSAAGSEFNGFSASKAAVFYVYSDEAS